MMPVDGRWKTKHVADKKRMLCMEFRTFVKILPSVVLQIRYNVSRQAESVVCLTQKNGPGIGSNSGINLTQLNGFVKCRLKQPSLAFTHGVVLLF